MRCLARRDVALCYWRGLSERWRGAVGRDVQYISKWHILSHYKYDFETRRGFIFVTTYFRRQWHFIFICILYRVYTSFFITAPGMYTPRIVNTFMSREKTGKTFSFFFKARRNYAIREVSIFGAPGVIQYYNIVRTKKNKTLKISVGEKFSGFLFFYFELLCQIYNVGYTATIFARSIFAGFYFIIARRGLKKLSVHLVWFAGFAFYFPAPRANGSARLLTAPGAAHKA